MKKWKYDIWEINDFENNGRKSDYYLFDYSAKLNELGDKGFEYVGNFETTKGQFMIFKKEIYRKKKEK